MSETIRRNKSMTYLLAALLGSTIVSFGCSQEGPTEKAGKKVDEAIESITQEDEGTMEKAGKKIDETIEAAKNELER